MKLTAELKEVIVFQTVEGLDLATDVELLGCVEEVLGTGVGVIVAAEDVDGLLDPAEHAARQYKSPFSRTAFTVAIRQMQKKKEKKKAYLSGW